MSIKICNKRRAIALNRTNEAQQGGRGRRKQTMITRYEGPWPTDSEERIKRMF